MKYNRINYDSRKVKLINALYPIRKLLDLDEYQTNIICPFHSDSDPSLHVYENKVWCFGKCHRFYYPINVIQKFSLSLEELYKELVDEHGESKLEEEYQKLILNQKVSSEKTKITRQPEESFEKFSERYFK